MAERNNLESFRSALICLAFGNDTAFAFSIINWAAMEADLLLEATARLSLPNNRVESIRESGASDPTWAEDRIAGKSWPFGQKTYSPMSRR